MLVIKAAQERGNAPYSQQLGIPKGILRIQPCSGPCHTPLPLNSIWGWATPPPSHTAAVPPPLALGELLACASLSPLGLAFGSVITLSWRPDPAFHSGPTSSLLDLGFVSSLCHLSLSVVIFWTCACLPTWVLPGPVLPHVLSVSAPVG